MQILEPSYYTYTVVITASFLATYMYMQQYKTYDIFNFEAVYFRLGGNNWGRITDTNKDVDYFNEILEHFTKMYKGIGFRWKLVERPKPVVDESLLDQFKKALLSNIFPERAAE